jgi:hypothetical protein
LLQELQYHIQIWPCPKPKAFSIFPTDGWRDGCMMGGRTETDGWKGQPAKDDKTNDIIEVDKD